MISAAGFAPGPTWELVAIVIRKRTNEEKWTGQGEAERQEMNGRNRSEELFQT